MTQADGLSKIHERVFEDRLRYTDQLRAMGADDLGREVRPARRLADRRPTRGPLRHPRRDHRADPPAGRRRPLPRHPRRRRGRPGRARRRRRDGRLRRPPPRPRLRGVRPQAAITRGPDHGAPSPPNPLSRFAVEGEPSRTFHPASARVRFTAIAATTSAIISRANRSSPNRAALARARAGDQVRRPRSSSAAANAATVASGTSNPVSPGITVSSAPPAARATTGRPAACASTAVSPKSSFAGSSSARQRARCSATAASSSRPRNSTSGPASRRSASPDRPSPMIFSGSPARAQAAIARSTRLCGTSRETTRHHGSGGASDAANARTAPDRPADGRPSRSARRRRGCARRRLASWRRSDRREPRRGGRRDAARQRSPPRSGAAERGCAPARR